uniref:Uncharacterized protein n=1 Tax=viral metagenome TaxID=1070528 RepID=A0A6C0JF40_9ZZZZ
MSQIFQLSFPKTLFFAFIDKYCEKNNNQHIFSKVAFKRMRLEEQVIPFCKNLKEYYFKSKHHYLDREQTYKNFTTIIRQLCKYLHIPFTSNINYSKSKYEINYFIYLDL